MEKSGLTQILMKSFNLNELQVEIYKLLLLKKILTLGEISIFLKKNKDECEKAVKDLTNLKLVTSIPGTIIRYKALPLFEGFLAQLRIFQSIFKKINEEISGKPENLISDFKNSMQNQMKDIQALFQSKKEELKKLEEQKEVQKLNISAYIAEIEAKLMNLLNQFQTSKMEPLSKIIDKILIDFKNIETENQKTLELSSVLNEIDQNAFLDTEKTWNIISSESILNYIMDMSLRTKKSISIILPHFTDFKPDYFKNLGSNVLIHIFSNMSLEKDNQILRELFSQGNIRIWHINGEYSFYCALRDAEEMLIAPYAENKKEIVGIVTEQKEYIKLFRKILGPFFHSVSNEVKK